MAPTALQLAIFLSGKTQREIADELGVHESQVSRWANGLHANEATRERIARVLGRQPEDLWPEPTKDAA